MAIKRNRLDVQLQQSTSPGALLTTNGATNVVFLENPGADRIPFYDFSANLIQWLTLGPGLSFNGTTLETSAGAGFISEVRDEGGSLGAGLTTLDFVGSGVTATAAGAIATISLDGDLNALADLSGVGYAVRTAANTWAQRTLTGTTGRVSVSNGDGTGGNPVIDIDSNVAFKNANETISANWSFSTTVLAAAVPTLGDHLVNKTYVDGLIAGVRRSSVFVATVVAGTLATSFENGDTVDTIVLSTGDRILIKNQAAQAENGIYEVQASGAPIRVIDMDAIDEVNGTLVLVGNGSQQGQLWYTVSNPVTMDVSPIVFTKIQTGVIDGSGAANQITYWADSDTLTGSGNFLYDPTVSPQMVLGDSAVTLLTTFTTKGTTDTNAAFGWAHKNSSGTQVYRVANDGTTVIGATNPLTITNANISRASTIAITATGASGNLTITTSSTSDESVSINPTGSATIKNGATLNTGAVARLTHTVAKSYASGGGGIGILDITGAITVVSGSGALSDITLRSTINQTGTATGITRGLNIIPTLTAAVDYRGIEINVDSSHYAMYSDSGNWRVDLGSDLEGDIFVRNAIGNLSRLAVGTANQTLIGGTTPTWGNAPVTPNECYITGVTGATVDLDANTGLVKDRDGNNIAFTAPTIGQKMLVFRGGALIDSDGTGGVPSRDYSVNTTSHVLTFAEALTSDETVYILKFN